MTPGISPSREEQGDYIQWLLQHMREKNLDVVDVKKQSEEDWAQHCAEADIATAAMRDCTRIFDLCWHMIHFVSHP